MWCFPKQSYRAAVAWMWNWESRTIVVEWETASLWSVSIVSFRSLLSPTLSQSTHGVGFVLIFPPPGDPKELIVAVVCNRLNFQ